MAKVLEVGDYIFSKNGIEFSAEVTAINGSKVEVTYRDDYEETDIISKSEFKNFDGEYWDIPNWTCHFDQL